MGAAGVEEPSVVCALVWYCDWCRLALDRYLEAKPPVKLIIRKVEASESSKILLLEVSSFLDSFIL